MGTAIILLAAVMARFFGAAARQSAGAFFYVIGWILCAIAGWLLASAAGAVSPLWLIIVLAVSGALIDYRRRREALWIAADALAVVSSALLSVLRVDYVALAGFVLLASAVGFGLDLLIRRSPNWLRMGTVGTLMVLLVVSISMAVVKFSNPVRAGLLLDMFRSGYFLYASVMPVHEEKRIVLTTGAVAWLDQPAGDGPYPAALLFHGANPEGSKQSSAIVLRRALLEAGFVVLAVDHPGYGASPAPSVDADIVAWDPLPTVLASLNTLRGLPNIDWIIAVGHSLGVTDILRLLHTKQDLRAVIVFGAALGDSTDSGDYWYKRFHTDRKMDKWIPLDRVLKIQERFYEDGRLLQDVYPQHPPIIFARFGLEWSKIAATRDAWYESIPGRKSLWDLNNSTHYFNSKKFMDLVVCDTRVTHSLATGLRHLASVSAEKVDGFTPSSR